MNARRPSRRDFLRTSALAAGAVAVGRLGVARRVRGAGSAPGAGAGAIKQVGLCYTGFGVPGSGRPFVFGTRALVNAGEGYPTVCDVSDPRRPRVLRYLPTWFFTTHIYPLPSRDLAYLSSSRGPLLVIRGLGDVARRGDVQEIPWQPAWGRSFLSGLRADGIGYTVRGGSILVLDLNDPDRPREVARIKQPRLKARPASGGDEQDARRSNDWELLTFCADHRLAAAVFDGGPKVALMEWKTPKQPTLAGELENASITEGKATVYGKVLAMDRRRLVLGHPASASPYWRCFRLSLWDISDPGRNPDGPGPPGMAVLRLRRDRRREPALFG